MFQKITRKNLDIFLARHASDKKVLDIGSGGSNYGQFFPNRVSVDIDPTRKPDIVADAHHLPFQNNEFEMVLCTEVLEHVKNPPLVIAEIERILKPRGTLILTTRFVYPLHDTPNDYWRFTKYGLRELFRRWEIVELEGETKNFSTIAVLLQRICFQSTLHANGLVKFLLFFLATAFDKINFLTKKEFGSIKKTQNEKELMPSGYYLYMRKK